MTDKTITSGQTSETRDEYGCDDGYFHTDIDMFPMTVKQQENLRKVFEILEIPHNSVLFGHTSIKIRTKELSSEKLKDIMDGEII